LKWRDRAGLVGDRTEIFLLCGLCGALAGADHWADAAVTAGGTRTQRRQLRNRVANEVLAYYGLSLKEAPGGSSLLQNRTGQTALVAHLGALWPAAEGLAKRPLDPLDPDLIAALTRQGAKIRV
jgi:hypothetical protein